MTDEKAPVVHFVNVKCQINVKYGTYNLTVVLFGWGVRQDGSFHVWINMWVAGKTV